MSNGNIDKLYKKKIKPSKGEEDALYFIGDRLSEFIDFYVTDKNGNLIPIINNSRLQNSENLSIIDYRSDVMNLGADYFYGYEFENNSFKIIKVEKGNVINQMKAVNGAGTFDDNWSNRETLTYN